MKYMTTVILMALTGCTTMRTTYPARSATEQMLISEASENAAHQFIMRGLEGRRCFLDTTNFDGVDFRYAASAIRQRLLEQGLSLMDRRDDADTVIEIRAGALSIDSQGKTIMIPAIPLNVLLPQLQTPLSYNRWTRMVDQGVAKFSAFAYDKASGRLISLASPVTGRSFRRSLHGEQVVVKKD